MQATDLLTLQRGEFFAKSQIVVSVTLTDRCCSSPQDNLKTSFTSSVYQARDASNI